MCTRRENVATNVSQGQVLSRSNGPYPHYDTLERYYGSKCLRDTVGQGPICLPPLWFATSVRWRCAALGPAVNVPGAWDKVSVIESKVEKLGYI
ncbi:hypothetical protein EIP86_001023 [Pleurotus ostreatoroseus]|nr:hypothetical protein EIP86_001023 [Pleurotus ostreatoroseus]